MTLFRYQNQEGYLSGIYQNRIGIDGLEMIRYFSNLFLSTT